MTYLSRPGYEYVIGGGIAPRSQAFPTPIHTMELTRHPGEIRAMQFNLAEQLDWEQYSRELMSFLPTSTLREFTEHLREVADIEDLITTEA